MNANERHPESIEHDEAWLAGMSTPHPSDEAIDRTRDAVHLALDEVWLDSHERPTPSRETVARVKRAVRAEIVARQRAARFRYVYGGLAAAATIALAILILRFAPGVKSPSPNPGPLSIPVIASVADVFGNSFDATLGPLASISSTDLDSSTSKPVRTLDPVTADLSTLQQQIDGLFTDTDYPSFEAS